MNQFDGATGCDDAKELLCAVSRKRMNRQRRCQMVGYIKCSEIAPGVLQNTW